MNDIPQSAQRYSLISVDQQCVTAILKIDVGVDFQIFGNDQRCAVTEWNVWPRPLQYDQQAVLEAGQKINVEHQPRQPAKKPVNFSRPISTIAWLRPIVAIWPLFVNRKGARIPGEIETGRSGDMLSLLHRHRRGSPLTTECQPRFIFYLQ